MSSRVLAKLRALVRSRQYVMTLHADEEMDADGFSNQLVIVTVYANES